MAHVIEDSFSDSERKRYIDNNRQLAIENSKKDRLLKEIYDENFLLRDQLREALSLAERKDAEIKKVRHQMKNQMKFLHSLCKPIIEFCDNQLTNDNNINNNDTFSLNNNNQSLAESPQSIDQQASLTAVENNQSLDQDIDNEVPTNNPGRKKSVDHIIAVDNCNQHLLPPISEESENRTRTNQSFNDSLEPRDLTSYVPSLHTEYQFATPSIFRFDDDPDDPNKSNNKTLTPNNMNPITPKRGNSALIFSSLRPDQHSTPVVSPAPKKKITRKRAAPEPSEEIAQETIPKRRYNLRNRK